MWRIAFVPASMKSRTLTATLAMACLASSAYARVEDTRVGSSTGFAHFRDAASAWASSSQGISFAVLAFVGGMLIGVVRNELKPVLLGMSVAWVISVGPDMLKLLTEGSLA